MTRAAFLPVLLRAARRVAVTAAGVTLLATQAYPQAIFLTAPQSISRVDKPPIDAARGRMAAPAPMAAPQYAPMPAYAPAATPLPAAAISPRPIATDASPLAGVGRPAAPLKARATMLRHLSNNIQGYRLAGEVGSSEWPIYITDRQARRRLQFQLGYLSAVSVMPEVSRLTLSINDQAVGQTAIIAIQSVKTVVFDIPPGLMRAGFNSIRITAEQRHRVDCSLEATQELWTQIDPTQTGLILDEADATIDAISDLGALPADAQGALPIRAVTPANPTSRDIERLLRVVQLISIIGRFEQPVVDVGPLAGGAYGANLVVGTAAELASTVGPQMVGLVNKPRAFVLPATADRRTTIVVTGADAQQVDEAIKQFLVATKPKGAAAGLRAAAAFPGFRMEGGQRVRLGDIGVRSSEFDGRLFRVAFNIIMPSDFYPADYGRATVKVAGGYSPGLTSKAQLVMFVNERVAVSLPLLKSTGEVFKDNPLPLPLGFLRPGLNRIEIEAHVPTPSDESCDTLAARDATNRFLFLDSTEFELPPIARVGRMPDLAVTATGGFPFAGAQRRSKLYMPRLDPKSIGAASTFVAHLAVVAGRPIDFEITQIPPLKNKGPTLAVAPYDALDPDLLRKLDMPVDDLSRVWREKIGVEGREVEEETPTTAAAAAVDAATRNRLILQNNFPMACHPPHSIGGFRAMLRNIDLIATGATEDEDPDAQPAEQTPDDEAAPDLFQEWDARLRNENRLSYILDWAKNAARWGTAKFTDAGDWMRTFDRTGQSSEMSPHTMLAVGQNILGDSSDNVWTVITAPNADALADSVACLVDPRVSRQIGGRLSLLDLSKARIELDPGLQRALRHHPTALHRQCAPHRRRLAVAECALLRRRGACDRPSARPLDAHVRAQRRKESAMRNALLAAGLLLCAALATPARAQQQPESPAADPAAPAAEAPAAPEPPKKPPRLILDARSMPLGGALKTPGVWQAYKARFVTDQGRVIDTGNNLISHSEGQGYAMLLAVAANDRANFDRIWSWTRANLMVRDDALLAWRWEPGKRPGVSDMNDASDGDILVAWALAEAGEFWNDMSYRTAGRRIAVEVARKVVIFKTKMGAILLPAVAGFHENDRSDGPVVNLSYYVFPAFARLPIIAPEVDWAGLSQTGLSLLDASRTANETLPPEWMSLKDWSTKPAEGFPAQFSYNAVRVPLYMAWAGVGEREAYEPFMALVKRTRGAMAIVDVVNGVEVGKFGDAGIGAIGALTACAVEGSKAPSQLFMLSPTDNYYPATLHLLSLLAMQMRYGSCLR